MIIYNIKTKIWWRPSSFQCLVVLLRRLHSFCWFRIPKSLCIPTSKQAFSSWPRRIRTIFVLKDQTAPRIPRNRSTKTRLHRFVALWRQGYRKQADSKRSCLNEGRGVSERNSRLWDEGGDGTSAGRWLSATSAGDRGNGKPRSDKSFYSMCSKMTFFVTTETSANYQQSGHESNQWALYGLKSSLFGTLQHGEDLPIEKEKTSAAKTMNVYKPWSSYTFVVYNKILTLPHRTGVPGCGKRCEITFRVTRRPLGLSHDPPDDAQHVFLRK